MVALALEIPGDNIVTLSARIKIFHIGYMASCGIHSLLHCVVWCSISWNPYQLQLSVARSTPSCFGCLLWAWFTRHYSGECYHSSLFAFSTPYPPVLQKKGCWHQLHQFSWWKAMVCPSRWGPSNAHPFGHSLPTSWCPTSLYQSLYPVPCSPTSKHWCSPQVPCINSMQHFISMGQHSMISSI